jgi:copper chaperone CopZ
LAPKLEDAMKKIKLALAGSMLAGMLSFSSAMACPDHDKAKSSENDSKAAPATATTAAFRVNGMHCAGCADEIKSALNKVDGVYKVDVKVADHRVIVSFDKTKITADKVAKLITDAGFEAAAEV